MDQQIAAVRAALAAIESAIAQTEAALTTAATPQDVVGLRSVLVDLRAERAKLQLQLASLEAAAVEVQPLGGPRRARAASGRAAPAAGAQRMVPRKKARMKALEKELTSAVVDRTVAAATLAFAKNVLIKARSVRAIGDADGPAPIKKPRGQRTASAVKTSAARAARRRRPK